MRPARWRPRAFTLVEVLLATVLAAMLLVALWSMLSMYSKVFEGGHARTEQSQLARTLFDQISTDLQAVRQVSPPTNAVDAFSTTAADLLSGSLSASPLPGPNDGPPSTASQTQPPRTAAAVQPPVTSATSSGVPTGSASDLRSPSSSMALPTTHLIATESLRPAGLFGTDTFLQIDVLQPAMIEPVREFDDTTEPGDSPPSQAEELKTIVYSFEESRESVAPTSEPVMHLLRREMDWEQAHPGERGGAGHSAQHTSPLAQAKSPTRSDSITAEDASDADPWLEDKHTTIVPEVLYFAMRYFDGSTWSDEWDSAARQGLPMAVEVTMQLRSHEEPEVASEGAPLEPGTDYEKVMRSRHPMHRLLIPLAAAHRGPSQGSPTFGQHSFGTTAPLGARTHGELGQP